MKKLILISALGAVGAAMAADKPEHLKRIEESATVLKEIMNAEDKGIPQDLLEKAYCVGVVPGVKRAGFIVGGKYGKGELTCRTTAGWSAPSTIRVEGGNIGFQIGGGETDVVFVVMNQRGLDGILKSKFTVGADGAAMAGPIGREASARTDAMMRAEILSYSRSRGVFAGIALDGSTLRPDNDDNAKIYGKNVSHADILTGKVKAPPEAQPLLAMLSPYAPKKGEVSSK
jgi:SH3 domain-containing YSC84-like protein 1